MVNILTFPEYIQFPNKNYAQSAHDTEWLSKARSGLDVDTAQQLG